MHPEPTHLTQKATPDQSSPDQSTHNQYGYDSNDNSFSPSRHDGEESGRSSPSPGQGVVAANSSAIDAEADERASRQLSPTASSRTGSPVDHIIAHEQASVLKSKGRRQRPIFSVVPSLRVSDHQHIALTDFPNGKILYTSPYVLAH